MCACCLGGRFWGAQTRLSQLDIFHRCAGRRSSENFGPVTLAQPHGCTQKMPRAAADFSSAPPNDDDEMNHGVSHTTTLLPSVARAAAKSEHGLEPAAASAAVRYDSQAAVVQAFLTNESGGAACYAVDLALVAEDALTPALTEAFGDMRRLMAFADTAGWQAAEQQASSSAAVLAAHATTGSGDETSTETQEFTLTIDLSAPRPITGISVGDRVNSSSSSKE